MTRSSFRKKEMLLMKGYVWRLLAVILCSIQVFLVRVGGMVP